jgi:hypothetical protein
MKKILLILLSGIVFTGCYNDPQSSTVEGHGFHVEYLFEKDGIKVYRFRDGGRTHYFTSKGETITTHHENKHEHEENISPEE